MTGVGICTVPQPQPWRSNVSSDGKSPQQPTGTVNGQAISVKRLLPLAFILVLAGLVFAMGWHRALSLETLVSHRSAIAAFVERHTLLAIAAFIGLYIAVVAISLPGGTILTVSGGIVFGTLIGGGAAVIGATIGATILFLIARTAFGEFLTRRAGPRLAKLADGFRNDAFNYLLFLRLVPIFPFWMVNLAPAMFGVDLGAFMAATSVGVIPATFTYAFVGAGLDSVIAAQEAAYNACMAAGRGDCKLDFDFKAALTPELFLGFAALGLIALVPVAVKRLRARKRNA
jgi:uncharacterized membrane protein YdjX (TVP38/TMEM64 family)